LLQALQLHLQLGASCWSLARLLLTCCLLLQVGWGVRGQQMMV
jgi:hypothetical protein